jgi:hypothetical protein
MEKFDYHKEFISQLLALVIGLVTFFAWPALQYILLKRSAKNKGAPELWFLPKYGFRLVIRGIPAKKTLTDINIRVRIRTIIPGSEGASAATFMDEVLVEQEDMFCFPGTDQVMITFKLERRGTSGGCFVFTDKLGNARKFFEFDTFDKLVCDYSATVKNYLNFDIRVAKRVELKTKSMISILDQIEAEPDVEKLFPLDRVRSVG